MESHPYFNLWLHSNAELESLLSTSLSERVTLHEWPLSCVQRLRLANGETWIYKAQFNEGVEAAFYARAHSPLLVHHRMLGVYRNTTAMLLEAINAPLLQQTAPDESGALDHIRRLETAIAQIQGDLPVYADWGTFERWEAFALGTCAKLETLNVDGCFTRVSPAGVNGLKQWARSAAVLAAVGQPAFAHADLSGNNVFITLDGYRVIDWQYPRRLAAGFDRASLLESLGYDPSRWVEPAVVGMMRFVRLAWFVECQIRLFPQGNYEASVLDLIAKIL
jgi:hypothetical protein